MTVGELLERLRDLDPGMEVRVAHQPGNPLQRELASLVTYEDLRAQLPAADDYGDDEDQVAWLVAGELADDPYAPHDLWGAA